MNLHEIGNNFLSFKARIAMISNKRVHIEGSNYLKNSLDSRVKLKKFYSLKQSVLIHLLSKILAFSAFVAFKGLKRPKKAQKKTFAK